MCDCPIFSSINGKDECPIEKKIYEMVKMPHMHENWDGNNVPYALVLNCKVKMNNSAD